MFQANDPTTAMPDNSEERPRQAGSQPAGPLYTILRHGRGQSQEQAAQRALEALGR